MTTTEQESNVTTLQQGAVTAADIQDAYDRGRADQTEVCVRHNLTRVADILDIIDRHAGDVEALRSGILDALRHGGPR